MSKIKLRPYQKNQVEFIEKRSKTNLGVAIQSPTGSGKSYMLLEYARRKMEEHKDKNYTIVIATGFNNLVYQLEEDAKEFGLKPLIWVGQGHLVSDKKLSERTGVPEELISIEDYQAFTNDPSLRASPKDRCVGRTCKMQEEGKGKCLFHQLKSKSKDFSPKIIITNHTMYLIALKYGIFDPNLSIVDESHAFASYYESFNTDRISPDEIKYIQSFLDDSDPTLMLFKKAINKGIMVSPQIFSRVKEKMIEKDKNNKKVREIVHKIEYFNNVEPGIDKFIEVSPHTGISVTNFWSSFEVDQENIDYVLVSATQDRFTMNMFKIPERNLYVEKDFHGIDYSKSKLMIYKDDSYEESARKFLSKMNEEGMSRGLMLSTTNKDINLLRKIGSIEGYKIYFKIGDFVNSKDDKAILAGSRALFQGVDIPDLDFVSLNRIPFPSYDDKFKAMSNYLKTIADINPWTGFTIPKVSNDITQSTGRLWRKPGDKGVIAIFDKRLDERFKYMIKYIQRERPRINIEVVE